MADEIHVGDIGTTFIVLVEENGVAIDISSATVKEILFKKPKRGGTVTKAAAFVTDGSDGLMRFVTTASTDLDVDGVWEIQGHVTLSASQEWHTDVEAFTVHPNL